jgi:glucose-6-phosphate 1-dehydrogenase
LWKAGKLPRNFLIIGAGLILWSNEEYREKILQQMIDRGFVKPDDWDEFAKHSEWHYLNIDENDLPGYFELKRRLVEFDIKNGVSSKWIFFGALPCECFPSLVEYLSLAGMLDDPKKSTVALEKPIAKSIENGRKLEATIVKHCHPGQVVCVEHFGLKPMAQAMPEFIETHPVMNNFQPENITAIEVIAAESIGVPSDRVKFFDNCSAMLDMHNHLLVPMLAEFCASLENRYR